MYLILTASPNKDGLTAACGEAALRGIEAADRKAKLIDLSEEKIKSCLICGNGWGKCINEHSCIINDSFNDLLLQLREAEGIVLVTPVYWGQPSERMKYFLDRYRRCEAFLREKCGVHGKKINLVAAAGGSGNGTISCLAEMEMWCRHLGAIPFARSEITRFNRDLMLSVIEHAATQLTQA